MMRQSLSAGDNPDTLRELARRCRVIARGTIDPDKTRILAYARTLEHRARELEHEHEDAAKN